MMLILVSWVLAGLFSAALQKLVDGSVYVPLWTHVALGPVALLSTIAVDVLLPAMSKDRSNE